MGRISKRLRNDTFSVRKKRKPNYDLLDDDMAILDKGLFPLLIQDRRSSPIIKIAAQVSDTVMINFNDLL